MTLRQQCINRLQMAAPRLRDEYGVVSLRLFGSMARGDNSESSDVDVCVEMPPKAFKLMALKDHLQHLLGLPVDIVRLHPHLDPFIINEISRDGVHIL